MPRFSVEQSTLPLSSRLRECDQLQIAIYDWGEQHKAVGTIEEAAMAGDQRPRVLDACLALDRRLDQIAALRRHRHERAEAGAQRTLRPTSNGPAIAPTRIEATAPATAPS